MSRSGAGKPIPPLLSGPFVFWPWCNAQLRDEKLWHLMRGLADAEPAVRMEAARALEQVEGKEAALLLRLKARMGDRNLAITEQLLECLLGIEGEAAILFVAEFLYQSGWPDKDEELMEHAALALGASRLPKALDVLIGCWQQRSSPSISATLLRSMSASRQEPALEFLVSLISSARKHDALAALEALSFFASKFREHFGTSAFFYRALRRRGSRVSFQASASCGFIVQPCYDVR